MRIPRKIETKWVRGIHCPIFWANTGNTAKGNCIPQRTEKRVRIICTTIPASLILRVRAEKAKVNPIRKGNIAASTARISMIFPETDNNPTILKKIIETTMGRKLRNREAIVAPSTREILFTGVDQ
jgi:hypothetical protein